LLLDERQWLLEHLHALAPSWPTDYVAGLIERSVQELAIRTPADRLAKLSERELEVWRQLSTPLSLSEISRRLFISRNTMKTHVRNIYRKLEVATREAAVAVASRPTEATRPGRRSG
jgi:ATP/maltotriose-dependent transcriptional regulator MalT